MMVCATLGPRAVQACELVVDPTGGGTHTTIQAAVDDLPNPGPCTVVVKAGTYRETISVANVNTLASSGAQRIVLTGLDGPVVLPPGKHGFVVSRSRFLTLQGFTLAGAAESAIALAGEEASNADITLAANDVHNNGGDGVDGGISIGSNNLRIWLANNLIRSNGRDGVTIQAGPSNDAAVFIVNNTIVGNGWNGVSVARSADVFLVNNVIVANGVTGGTTGGRWGFIRERTAGEAAAPHIALLSNVFYRNGAGRPPSIGGDIGNVEQTLDAADEGNLTTSGMEGAGVAGCTFVDCTAAPGLAALFVGAGLGPSFKLKAGSPAVGRGRPSVIVAGAEWVPAVDFEGRRRGATGRVDIGYLESR